MKPIIDPIDVNLIKAELNENVFVRNTNKAGNQIYVINSHCAPYTMTEIGRLRELAFRESGGGSGESLDTDEFDYLPEPYNQLIVWNPDAEEIIGGYSYILGHDVVMKPNGQAYMAMEHIFNFSGNYITNYLPHTLELARAFVQPKYQSTQEGIKSLYALDNLWDGIGALVVQNPDVKYMIGKVTIYSQTPEVARKAMIYYLNRFFGDHDHLIVGKKTEVLTEQENSFYDTIFIGNDYKQNFKILNSFVREHNSTIPALIHAYIELSPSMRTFGTVFDPDFGDIFDTGMMITVDDIYQVKRDRYIETYIQQLAEMRGPKLIL